MRLPVAILLCAAAAVPPAQSADVPPAGRELVQDAHFRQGFQMWAPKPGKKVDAGVLRWDEVTGRPAWGMAQWASRFPFESPVAERLPDGGARFRNAGKTMVVGPHGSADADLVLGVCASAEYQGRARRQGEPWVHLLVEQTFVGCPALSDLREIRFHLEARLRSAKKIPTPDYSAGIHAAQFLVYFTVQNLNRRSPGYGDYYWFGIPVYDDRQSVVARAAHGDAGTGKMIYSTPGDCYAKTSTHSGQWVTFDGDLLPEMLDGLRTAWGRGFLKDSRDLADYRIGGMNMGWEVPGLFDVEVQVRNLSMRTVEK